MKALSGFTGVPVVVSGFAAATEMYNKRKVLKDLLQRGSDTSVNIDTIVANRLRDQSVEGLGQDNYSISPTIGNRKWFKRQSDGALFQCVASTWGKAAVHCESTQESDIIKMTGDNGWVSSTHGHSYVRVPDVYRA